MAKIAERAHTVPTILAAAFGSCRILFGDVNRSVLYRGGGRNDIRFVSRYGWSIIREA